MTKAIEAAAARLIKLAKAEGARTERARIVALMREDAKEAELLGNTEGADMMRDLASSLGQERAS